MVFSNIETGPSQGQSLIRFNNSLSLSFYLPLSLSLSLSPSLSLSLSFNLSFPLSLFSSSAVHCNKLCMFWCPLRGEGGLREGPHPGEFIGRKQKVPKTGLCLQKALSPMSCQVLNNMTPLSLHGLIFFFSVSLSPSLSLSLSFSPTSTMPAMFCLSGVAS